MIFKWSLLCLCALVNISDSTFVETLQKCSVSNNPCLKNLIQRVMNKMSNGIDELNIKPIDPISIENKSVKILGLIDVTVVEGLVTGAKDCKVNNFHVDLSKREQNIDVTCDLKFKGRYKTKGEGDIIKNLFGGQNIHGEGNAEVKLDKLQIKMKLFYDNVKKEDGEIYAKIRFKKTVAEYDVAGFKMTVDNIFLGDQDASQLVNGYMNNNYNAVVHSDIGKQIFHVGMDIFYEVLNNFYFKVPVRYYLLDDVSQYVKH